MPVADPNDGLWLVEWEEPAYGLTANSEHGRIASTPKKQRRFGDRDAALVFIAGLDDLPRSFASLRDLKGDSILHGSKLKDELARLRSDRRAAPP